MQIGLALIGLIFAAAAGGCGAVVNASREGVICALFTAGAAARRGRLTRM